eukprot:s218_g5.t1
MLHLPVQSKKFYSSGSNRCNMEDPARQFEDPFRTHDSTARPPDRSAEEEARPTKPAAEPWWPSKEGSAPCPSPPRSELSKSGTSGHVGPRSQPAEHLLVLLQAEQVLVKRLRQDVAEWSQELHRLEEACRREEKVAGREEAEVQKLETERGHLMQQLDLSQRQLAELRLEHRRHQESALLISGVRKQQEEAFFLQRLREEYSRDSEAMEVSLTKLELASLSMEGQGRALQQETQAVHEQAKAEQARLDVEKRELQALQKALLSLRSTPPSPSAPTPGFGGWDSPFGSTLFSGVGPEAWSSGVSLVDDSPWRRSPAGAGVPTFRDGV